MNKSIKEELTAHVRDLIQDGVITEDNLDDAHYHAFNEDYYIIGYYNAEQWLKKHDLSASEAIGFIVDQEILMFGESRLKPEDIDSERIVNLYVYFASGFIDIYSIFEEEQNANEYFKAVEA